MSKLNQEELSKTIEKWTDFYKPHIHNKELPYWLPEDEQAYQQIKEMIKNIDLPEFLRGIASKQHEVDNLKKHIKNIEERCVELIQKSGATEEWIEEKAMTLCRMADIFNNIEAAKGFIRSLVEEIK